MRTVVDNLDLLLEGLLITLQLSAVIILLGTAIGVLGGLGLLYGRRWLRALIRLYVDVVRGTPVLVLIFLTYFVLPELVPAVEVELSGFQAVTIALSFFAGAHVSEIVRGAVAVVPNAQTDAAKSLGLTFWPRIQYVILPQALPAILPPWINTAIEMVKGTSLAALVSVGDLLQETQQVVERTNDAMPLYITAAAIYVVLNLAISRAGAWFERRLSYATG